MILQAQALTQVTPGDIESVSKMISEYGVMTVGVAILFLILIGLFSFFIIQYNRLNKIIDGLLKSLTSHLSENEGHDEIEKDIVNFHMSVNTTMRDHLRMLRDTLDVDRTFVFTFHNNEKSINGFPYLKGSCHIEYSLWNLEHNNIMDQRDIQSSALTTLVINLMNPGAFICPDIEKIRDEDPMFYGWLRRIRSKSFFAKVLEDSRGKLIGFVGCDYITEVASAEHLEKIDQELAATATAISAILDIQKKVDRRVKNVKE